MEEVLEKVSRNKAMQILGLSRHTFDKLIEDKSITVHEEEKKKFYLENRTLFQRKKKMQIFLKKSLRKKTEENFIRQYADWN